MNNPDLHSKTLILLLALVSIAFIWILTPFFGAIFWGTVLAIMFTPFHRWIQRKLRRRPILAALTTLGICLILVILPMILIAVNLASEGTNLYEKLSSGEIDIRASLQNIFNALPVWDVETAGAAGRERGKQVPIMCDSGNLGMPLGTSPGS